jgi:hypothetical protein
MQVVVVDARTSDDFERAFARLSANGVNGVLLLADPTIIEQSQRITSAQLSSIRSNFGRFRTVSTRAREAEWELGTLATDNIVRHSRRAEITTLHEVSWMRPRVPPTQRRLPAICPLNEAPHLIPPRITQESYRENQI